MSQSDHRMKKRYLEKFVVKKAITERFRKSVIPNRTERIRRKRKFLK